MTDRIKGTEEIQVELERGMQEAGRLRYQRAVDAAILRGVEAQTPYGQRLLSIHTEAFANAIDAFMEEAKAKRGRRHSAIEYLQQIDSRTAAWMALREIVSRMRNTRLKMTSLGLYIGRSILTEIEMRKLRKDNKALYTGILRSTERKTQQFRKEATARFLQEKENLDVQSKNRDHCELIGVKLIEIAVEKLGIISLELEHKHSARGRKVTHERAYIVRPTMELVNWVKEGHTIFSELDPIYEPMVVPPVPWSHPLVGGYLWNEQTDIVEVLCPEAFAVHEGDVALWYEVKDGLERFKERDVAIIEWGYFAWLGLPHNRDIEDYLSEVLG